MSEDRGADRPCHKADRIYREGFQRPNPGIGMRKEQLREDEAGDRAVEKEIVAFDRGPDCGSDDGETKLELMLALSQPVGIESARCHGIVPLRQAPTWVTSWVV